MTSRDLVLYTVYDNPKDYPGKFVVRRWELLNPDKEPLIVADTLEQARGVIPPNLYHLPRFPTDEPQIVEVWL